MSYCKELGKDRIIFATKEDHSVPSKVILPAPEPKPGLILPDGTINWNCPCLGGMATGPCGVEFRDAFSCFHYSEAKPKGTDCFDAFKTMQECMVKFPSLYGKENDESEEAFEALANESSELQDQVSKLDEQKKNEEIPEVTA